MELDRIIAVRNTKTVYRDGNEAIKVFIRAYDKADILTEAANLARMEAAELPVPKLLRLETPAGRWAIVMQFLRGRTLAQLLARGALSMDEAAGHMAALAAQVHAAPGRGLCPLVTILKDDLARAALPEQTRAALFTRLAALPEGSGVCHGDLAPENILLGSDGKLRLLDWPHASRGCGAADAAYSCIRLHLDGQTELARRFAARYCAASGADAAFLAAWSPVVAAARSVHARPGRREALLKLAARCL